MAVLDPMWGLQGLRGLLELMVPQKMCWDLSAIPLTLGEVVEPFSTNMLLRDGTAPLRASFIIPGVDPGQLPWDHGEVELGACALAGTLLGAHVHWSWGLCADGILAMAHPIGV